LEVSNFCLFQVVSSCEQDFVNDVGPLSMANSKPNERRFSSGAGGICGNCGKHVRILNHFDEILEFQPWQGYA
jgi:hypothetical protein